MTAAAGCSVRSAAIATADSTTIETFPPAKLVRMKRDLTPAQVDAELLAAGAELAPNDDPGYEDDEWTIFVAPALDTTETDEDTTEPE